MQEDLKGMWPLVLSDTNTRQFLSERTSHSHTAAVTVARAAPSGSDHHQHRCWPRRARLLVTQFRWLTSNENQDFLSPETKVSKQHAAFSPEANPPLRCFGKTVQENILAAVLKSTMGFTTLLPTCCKLSVWLQRLFWKRNLLVNGIYLYQTLAQEKGIGLGRWCVK